MDRTGAGHRAPLLPDVFCAKRASWMTASLGWTAALGLEDGAGTEEASSSMGTGEPSRDRLSGVWTPLE